MNQHHKDLITITMRLKKENPNFSEVELKELLKKEVNRFLYGEISFGQLLGEEVEEGSFCIYCLQKIAPGEIMCEEDQIKTDWLFNKIQVDEKIRSEYENEINKFEQKLDKVLHIPVTKEQKGMKQILLPDYKQMFEPIKKDVQTFKVLFGKETNIQEIKLPEKIMIDKYSSALYFGDDFIEKKKLAKPFALVIASLAAVLVYFLAALV